MKYVIKRNVQQRSTGKSRYVPKNRTTHNTNPLLFSLKASTSYAEADELVEEYTNYKTFKQKANFLRHMLNLGENIFNTKNPEADYVNMLGMLVNTRYER